MIPRPARMPSSVRKKAADIAQELGADLMVLWLAREGTYLREAKNAGRAAHQLLEAINTLLAYDAQLRIAVEPKPNEPMDLAYIPTMGHALALGFQSSDPKRVGVLMEIGALAVGRPRSRRRDRVCHGLRQVVERAPERSERAEFDQDRVVRGGEPARRV